MRRREFITLLGGIAAAWPLPSRAQQRKAMPRVGVLWHAANAREEAEYLGALTKAFHELGYVEGKNIELDHRFPAEQPDRYRRQGGQAGHRHHPHRACRRSGSGR